VIYVTKIFELRNWIDELGNELSIKIFRLSHLLKQSLQNISINAKYVSLTNSDFSRLIRKKGQEKAVLRKFKENTQLIERQEANHS
jgi:hypothetical protein